MHQGSCLCRAVRYEIDGRIGASTHCHCTMCRKFHGAAFATYAWVRRARLRIVSGADSLSVYASSDMVNRTFCSRCGSSLFWETRDAPDAVAIALGALDDEPDAAPRAHIFFADKAGWVTAEDGLPRFDTLEPQP